MNKIRLQKCILFLLAAAVSGMLSSCALVDADKSLLAPQRWDNIDRTRENSKKLRVGMTKAEVRKIMGEPLVNEPYNTDDQWFYYARTRWSDGRITRDECLPLVFDQDGRLEGWGVEFYRTHYNYTGWTDKAIRRVLE